VTDQEFEVLDELYFVTSFKALITAVGWSSDEVFKPLSEMVEKGWVKCLDPTSEQEVECKSATELRNKVEQVLFLATKKGLFEHNSK
jgi:hypothetical protein